MGTRTHISVSRHPCRPSPAAVRARTLLTRCVCLRSGLFVCLFLFGLWDRPKSSKQTSRVGQHIKTQRFSHMDFTRGLGSGSPPPRRATTFPPLRGSSAATPNPSLERGSAAPPPGQGLGRRESTRGLEGANHYLLAFVFPLWFVRQGPNSLPTHIYCATLHF